MPSRSDSEAPRPGTVDRLVAGYAGLVERRGVWLLLLALLLAGAGGALLPGVKIDPRLEALLPPDTPHQRALREARERFANEAPMYLVVQSSDATLNRTLQAEILKAVLAWPETAWAISRRDPDYFLNRRLLYLPADVLQTLADAVEARVRWEACEVRPACVNLEARPPDPDFTALRASYESVPELATVIGLFGADSIPDPEAATRPAPPETLPESMPAVPASMPVGDVELHVHGERLGDLCGPDGGVCVVQAYMTGDPSDLAYATRMFEKGEALLASLRPADAPADLILAVTGRYRNVPRSVEAVQDDLSRTAALSISLVLLVLVLQFRGVRALLLLIVPLLTAAGWTAAAIALIHPRLNLISAAMLPVLVGLGIDFTLHTLTHYAGHRRGGVAVPEAIRKTLRSLLAPLLAASFTTGCGFGALALASFRGFAEVGLIAAMSIGLTVVATFVVFPPLALVLDRVWAEKGTPVRRWAFMDRVVGPPGRIRVWATVAVGLCMLAGGVTLAPRIGFASDYRSLSRRATGHGTNYGPALHGTRGLAVLIMADDAEALTMAVDGLRSLAAEVGGAGRPMWVLTWQMFVPDGQDERMVALARLHEAAKKSLRYVDDRLAARIEAWMPLLALDGPIRGEDLPRWVLNTFTEKDGSLGRIGILYTNGNSSDATDMEHLRSDIETWQARFTGVRFASPAALLGDVVPGLRADMPLLVGMAALGLALGTLLIGRSLSRTALVLLPVVVAMAGTLGGMALLGWQVHLYNLLVFPLAFGLGVDGAIYVVWAAWRGRGNPLSWKELPISAQAVLGSSLTTLAGFGGLVISTNAGVASMGRLAVLAIALALVINLVWLPSFLSVLTPTARVGRRP